jgi:hypothetical protein
MKVRRTVAVLVVGLISVAGCSFTQEAWDDNAVRQLQTEMCRETLGIGGESGTCRCAIAAVKRNFETPEEFSRSTSPPDGLVRDFLACGLGFG